MKTPYTFTFCRWSSILAAILLPVSFARANPISMPEKPLTPEISFVIGCAILVEVTCIAFLLRRTRRPRFLVFWIAGMHVFTYPAFLSLLWLLSEIRPAFAVAIGEGLVVLVEGGLIYLICRFAPSANPGLATPSAIKCGFASFVGNACSSGVFPILIAMYEHKGGTH